MSRTITVNSVDLTDKIRLESFSFVEAANRGEVGTGGFDLHDSNASVTLPALKSVTVAESAATGNTRLFTGFTHDRATQRGINKVASAREWAVEMTDLNVLATDYVLARDEGAERPEETDYARITWLLTTRFGDVVAAGVVPNTNTVTLEPTSYIGRNPADVLAEASEAAGKLWFVYDYGAGELLYYDLATGTSLSSSASISDVAADVNSSTVWAPQGAPRVKRSPDRIFSAVYLQYKNGTVYVEDSGTEGTYRTREATISDASIATQSLATTKAQAFLDGAANEILEIEGLAVRLPAANVNDIRAGQRVQIKLTRHGISSYTYYRVTRRIVEPLGGQGGASDVEYLVSLTLLSDVLAAAIGGRGDDVIDYGEDGDGTAGCGRSVALLPSGMDSELSLESGGGEQIYAHDPDAELLAKYNLDLSTRVWSVTASGGVPYVTHQPGTWVPANFGDKAYRRDTGAEEWDITGSITAIAAQTQDVRHFWVTSGGAASWSSENANISTAHLNDIATDGAGNWGAVGSSGYLSYSTDDGATWTGTQVFSTNTMRGIAYGNGYWVAVGTTNTAYRLYTATSLSGSWTSRTISGLNANADDSLTSVAYGNSIWVAVGDGHAPGVYAIATTGSDPTTGWTARTVTDAAGHTQADPTFGPDMDVAYGNGRFVVVGGDDIATSTNGTTWTNYGEIANGGGDDGGVLSSMVSVTYGAGVWLVSGSSNSTVVSGNPVTGVMYNDDVTDMFGWTGINPFSGSAPYDIEYGDQFMAIVGDGTIFASATGTSGWANDDSSFFTATPFFPFEFTGGIAYGDGVWAAGGDTADAGPLIVRTGGPVLQVRDSEDGSLITETSLSSEGTSMRRSASGQFAMVQQGSNTLLRFNRSAVLQDTVTITGFFDPNNKDWAVDDAYYVYKLGSNTLVRYDPSGVQLWSANLNSRHDYRFPSLVTTGNGNQVVVTDFVRVVGYIGEADWDDDPSEAVLLTIAKTTGDTKIIQRFGGDADDSAQAEAVHHHASGCVYIAGAAVGTEFEGESLSGTRGWILRVGQDNITDTAGESIYGVVFPSLSSDPASGDSTDGQVYYNTTTDKLRVRANGTWVDLH